MKSRSVLGAFVAGCMVMSAAAFAAAPDQPVYSKIVPVGPPKLTAEQKSEAVSRMDLAKKIIANIAPEAERMGLAAEWKQATMNLLLGNSASRLSEIASIGGYQATIAAATGKRGMAKTIGSTTTDLVFVPWTPCRFVDTRVIGGKISGSRGYDLSLNGSSYGGVAGCAPTTLAGVNENSFGAMAMNITITDTSTAGAPGFAAARPTGSTALTSLVNWYTAGTAVTDANAAIVQMDQSGAANEFEIVTSGPVHVIIDLFGAFTAPTATPLDCQDVYGGAIAVPAGGEVCGDPPACPTGYTATATFFDNIGFSGLAISQLNGPGTAPSLLVCGRSFGGATSFAAGARCCRIPGH